MTRTALADPACAELWRELHILPALVRAVRPAAPQPRARSAAPVLIVPGFGVGDAAMALLHRSLRSQGFRTYGWQLGVNRGPRLGTLRALRARLRSIAQRHGQRVHVVGWSLGGLLARVVAARASDCVGHVVTLGTPLSADPGCSWLSGVVRRAVGHPRFETLVRRLLRESARAPVTSLFSRNDGVVHWRASVDGPGEVKAVEVDTTHLGLVADPRVFAKVAGVLARAPRHRDDASSTTARRRV